ncbi:MAG: hypothetical protein JO345_34455 [Streptosporangiaceae bacterium]|nr:hypothetical protein [Streptosporangiaceae bacterium]
MEHKIIGYGHGQTTVQPVRGDELVVTDQMQADLERARRELAISAALSAPGSLAGATAGSYLGAVAAEQGQIAREER